MSSNEKIKLVQKYYDLWFFELYIICKSTCRTYLEIWAIRLIVHDITYLLHLHLRPQQKNEGR